MNEKYRNLFQNFKIKKLPSAQPELEDNNENDIGTLVWKIMFELGV